MRGREHPRQNASSYSGYDQASLQAVKDDIAWAFLDFDRNALQTEPDARFASLPIYKGPLDGTPKDGELYAFAAVNRDEHHRSIGAVRREVSWEACMTLAGLDPVEVRFSLARQHQGDAYYFGASGSPIADRTGAAVAVLVGAGRGPNELRAASLSRFVATMTAIERNEQLTNAGILSGGSL